MSGIASLAVATAVQFGWVTQERIGQPNVWWIISACCFFSATFLAWRDEYEAKQRLETEQAGPQVTLEFNRSVKLWMLANSGSDAFNVKSSPIKYGNRYAVIHPIPKIARGDRVRLSFSLFRNDGYNLSLQEATLEHLFRAILDDRSIPDSEFKEQISIPVKLTYIDVFSRGFETLCTIQWDLVRDQGQVIHEIVRSATESVYKRLVRHLFRRQ